MILKTMSCGTKLKKFLKIIYHHEDLWSLSKGRYHSPSSYSIKSKLAIGSVWEIIEVVNEYKYVLYNQESDTSTWMTDIEATRYTDLMIFNYNKIWSELNENFL